MLCIRLHAQGRRQYWMDKLVGDVLGLIKAADHERCVLVAHDWGGGVAWAVAANHPEARMPPAHLPATREECPLAAVLRGARGPAVPALASARVQSTSSTYG